MKALFSRLSASLLVFLVVVAIMSVGVFVYGYRQALEQVSARAESDLALASDRLVTGLQRYRMTAVLMADHPTLQGLEDGGARAAANALLLEAVDKAGALDAYYLDRSGTVLASAHTGFPEAVVGSAFFQRALQGALGVAHGDAVRTDRRAYAYAAPSFGADGQVQGVLILVVDIDDLEEEWRGTNPSVFFTDDAGVIFVTNRSELLGWQRVDGGYRDLDGYLRRIAARAFGAYEIWQQDFSPYIPETALHKVKPLPVIGMVGEVLIDVSQAMRIALLQAAVVAVLSVFFGGLAFVALIRRRDLALANVQLERRVRARTQDLQSANTALRREVQEREEAEAALKRAQADLVQAGKLSALGQMSAGISHELNQPLMAIRQYAENGEAFLARGKTDVAGENLSRITQLAARAARIIKNLRAFARNESEPMGKVDIVSVLGQAVELTEARLSRDGVTLDWRTAGQGPVWVKGGEVRLTQVFVNLINNAADAMVGQATKRIVLEMDLGPRVHVSVRDTGPGIADPERVFEPFYSTKQVGEGEGMGLGLSISYGLVQSFGGNIHGVNADGGAVFTVELDPWQEEKAA